MIAKNQDIKDWASKNQRFLYLKKWKEQTFDPKIKKLQKELEKNPTMRQNTLMATKKNTKRKAFERRSTLKDLDLAPEEMSVFINLDD